MSEKRKKVLPLLDSDTSDEERNNKVTEKGSDKMCRSSERLKEKKSKYFHMPTREDVFKKIPHTKTPDKYSHLKPRKLVNSFTKENSRYNYDVCETSGSESLDDFIIYDEDDDDDNDDVTAEYIGDSRKIPNELKPKHKILNWHKRLIVESDSDSEASRLMPNQESSHENIQIEHDNEHISNLSDEHANRKTELRQIAASYEPEKKLGGCAVQLKESVEVGVFKESCQGNSAYVQNDSDHEIKTLKKKQKTNPIISDSEDDEVSEKQRKVDNQNYISEKDEQINKKYEIESTSLLENVVESSEQMAERKDAECENKIDEGVGKTNLRIVDSLAIAERSSNDSCSDDESSCSSQIKHSNNDSSTSNNGDSDSSGSTSSSGGDSDEHVTPSRVRVKNIRKQKAREMLFEKFRNLRKKRISKGLEK